MIGSSNLTQNALGKNTEVNLGVSAKRESGLYRQTLQQLNFWEVKSENVTQESLAAYSLSWSVRHCFK